MSDPLLLKLKTLIVETLRLEDVTPADIADDEPLIGGGLSLDSIDALELVVRLEKSPAAKNPKPPCRASADSRLICVNTPIRRVFLPPDVRRRSFDSCRRLRRTHRFRR
jgi:acyl carrier protein